MPYSRGSSLHSLDQTGARLFAAAYGRAPGLLASAPGRVNLIGDHIDYCGGTVLPMAIERCCIAAVLTEQADAPWCEISSLDSDASHRVRLDRPIEPGPEGEPVAWHAYAVGVLAQLQRLGSIERLSGCRIAVATDVPLGAGLSSSAALEVSVARAASAWLGLSIEPIALAKLCQRAEHEFARVPCGLMDQAVSVLARAGHALMLDCSTDSFEHIALDGRAEFTIIDSGVRHALADGEYAKRRDACERIARELGVRDLATASLEAVEGAAAELRPFGRHVVTENRRVHAFARALADADLAKAGGLMIESHRSLRDDFKVSCPEVDALVDAVSACPTVFGARMTGGGFGGCIVVLHEPTVSGRLEELAIKLVNPRENGPMVLRSAPAAGAMNRPIVTDPTSAQIGPEP